MKKQLSTRKELRIGLFCGRADKTEREVDFLNHPTANDRVKD